MHLLSIAFGVNNSFFHYIKIQMRLLTKIIAVNNAFILTIKGYVCSGVRKLISHTWEVIMINWVLSLCSLSLKTINYASFLTDIDFFMQLTYISLCSYLKCLLLPYKKCKNCPQYLTSSRLQHSAISATVFN